MLQGIRAPVLPRAGEHQSNVSVQHPRRGYAAVEVAPQASPPDPQLFDRLKRLRTELAEEEGVAPFIIFHDKTLKAIASFNPVTSAALMEIPGIGDLKVERYGRRVLQVVNGET